MTTITNQDANGGLLAEVAVELERLFNEFNTSIFEGSLSKPVITVAPKGQKNAAGWCSRKEIWRDGKQREFYEINICAEHLNRDIYAVCGTLLHEMVHLWNAQSGIQDCSRSSQYHNKYFKEAAEKYGLRVEKDYNRGFALTEITPETRNYLESLSLKDFDLCRSLAPQQENAKRSTRRYCCPQCKTVIRATKAVDVVCKRCNRDFAYG
jgi:hypothetical protein